MNTRTAASLVLCLVAVHQTLGDQRPCGQASDMVFVLDVSSSIRRADYQHMLDFVTNVASELDVGPGQYQTRVAALTFSTGVKPEFSLNRYMNKTQLLENIQKIRFRGGNTNTHLALKSVDRNTFHPSRGARPLSDNVSRIVIVITDGVSREAGATKEAAESLREHGARIFAIGVGRERDVAQLTDMASRPAEHYVFVAENFRRLADLKDRLVQKACQVTTTTAPPTTTAMSTTPVPTSSPSPSPTTTTAATSTAPDIPLNDRPWPEEGEEVCTNFPADVYFLLDSSSSIWKNHFENNILKFVHDVINLYEVGKHRTRVGVITFSDVAHQVFGLNSFPHKDALLKALNKIRYIPGATNTAQALQEAGYRLETEGREDVQQMILLITDGQSKNPRSTVETARALRQRGVRVLAVGVGDSVDAGELKAVQGEGEVMMVGNFQSLVRHSHLLAARSCTPQGSRPWVMLGDATPSPSPVRCSLGQADIVFTYDSAALGTQVVFDLSTTLHHLTTTLTLRGADVMMGVMTSGPCAFPGGGVFQALVPLSDAATFGKYTRSVVFRSQLHRLLKEVRTSAFTPLNGYRGAAARKMVVMVLDDGSASSVLHQMARESAKMRSEGMEVFLVTSGSRWGHDDEGSGGGSNALWQEFQLPAPGHVIRLPGLDFSDHGYASTVIASALCGDNWV